MSTVSFYIYGAGIVATSIYTAINNLYNCKPIAFLVSSLEENPVKIDDIPVLEISKEKTLDDLSKYLIATPEAHHAVIADSLYKLGIAQKQLIFVDNQLENTLMEAYFSNIQEITTLSELLCATRHDAVAAEECVVYQAKCHVDKTLKGNFPIPKYVHPIQVGSALTDEIIEEIRDNIGKNISYKNRNYCELTATYYAWKNCQEQYKGLCHYRRIFDITDEQLQVLLSEHKEVDVILPYPSIHYPDISGQHNRYVNEQDWSAMLQAMQEVAPEYYTAYMSTISKENYFYNFNMLIAKKEVYDDYCQFLFSVLERTEELATPRGWGRADRFAGYLGENLTTIYFRKNRDKLQCVHTGKIWLT